MPVGIPQSVYFSLKRPLGSVCCERQSSLDSVLNYVPHATRTCLFDRFFYDYLPIYFFFLRVTSFDKIFCKKFRVSFFLLFYFILFYFILFSPNTALSLDTLKQVSTELYSHQRVSCRQ
jgi:hypothetical protein